MKRTSPFRPASRRLVLALSVFTLTTIGLGACGVTNDGASKASVPPVAVTEGGTPVGSPRVIKASGAPAGGAAEMSATPAVGAAPASDGKIATSWFAPTNYVWQGDATGLDAPAGSWFFPTGGQPTTEQMAALAAAFGLSGEFAAVPTDEGGGWAIGARDGSAAGLTVSPDGMLSWYYSPDPSVYVAAGVDNCAAVAVAVGDPGASTPPAAAPACPEPTPPAGVPTADEAKAKALTLFTTLGIDPASYSIDVVGDEWGRSVNASLLLDGNKTPVALTVGYGANGVVTWANGHLAMPQRGDDYPRIGIEAAIAKLNEQATTWRGGIEPMPAMADAGVAAQSAAAPTAGARVVEPCLMQMDSDLAAQSGIAVAPLAGDPAPAVSEAVVAGDAAAAAPAIEPAPSIDPALVIDPAVTPAVVVDPAVGLGADCAPAEPITVTLTGVTADLTMIWDVENTIWLLPAYTFTSPDGGQYQVAAIDDGFLQYEDGADTSGAAVSGGGDGVAPETPVAVESGAPIDAAAAEVLVGLSQGDAERQAATSGWSVRVVRLDGEDLPATADFSPTRVNVAVSDGVVERVMSIG